MARSTQETHSQAGPSSPPSNPRKRPSTANKEASVSFVYNPRQDADSRRAVRSDYRALIAQAEESKRDSTLKPSDLLLLINKADELHERVVAPSESILDTKTLGNMSEMGARMAKKMKLNQDAFDTHEFMTRLARFLGGQAAPARTHATSGGDNHTNDDGSSDEDESTTRIGRDGTRGLDTWNWSKLGYLAASVSRRAPTMDFILGPLEIVAKQRKIITRTRADECNVEKTAPRALQQQDLQNSAGKESTSQIRQVAKVLAQQGSGGICLFKFAVDPESFVNTIENFFHVSFLIKENKASLKTDQDGNAILAIAQPPNDEEEEEGGGGEGEGEEGQEQGEGSKSKQFIMEIDYETYLDSIELYGIEKSIIPTRPNSVNPLNGREALARAKTRIVVNGQ